MDSSRFETFIDAILAIMLTVMVLKIPQPETLTFAGIWDLRVMHFAYFLSFIVIFSVWDHHRKLFVVLKEISNTVIAIYAVLIFIITLVPFFTAWVAHEPYAVLPELMYGLIFLLVNILFILATRVAVKHDTYNDLVDDISFNEVLFLNLGLFIAGAILTLIGFPLSMLIMCLLTVITWNVIPHIQKTYVIGDDHGN